MKSQKTEPNEIEQRVSMRVDKVDLEGILAIPDDAKGIVLFAHGSGSSRLSPRNRYVAAELNKFKVATLLFDLLTLEEERVDMQTGQFRFNIEFLTSRLIAATKWVKKNNNIKKLTVGYFGASTGAAACLVAAAKLSVVIHAVVSRGGRPDLAEPWLSSVKAPTLLIVGALDTQVIGMNEKAFNKLDTKKKMVIIPAASHLFEEPGALEEVALLAKDWFSEHL